MFHQFAEKERDVILLPTIMPGCYQLSLAENETQSCEDAVPLCFDNNSIVRPYSRHRPLESSPQLIFDNT